jgi:membrane protease YdiL (CAAX protease family)
MTCKQSAWSGKNAWWCILCLLLSQLVLVACIIILEEVFHLTLRSSPFKLFLIQAISGIVALLVTIVFSGVKRFADLKVFGLGKINWMYVGMSVVLGLLLAESALFLVKFTHESPQSMLMKEMSNFGQRGYHYLYAILLISPFFEEFIMRGYIYKAFRGNYSIPSSIFFSVVISAFIHPSILQNFGIAILAILSLNLLVCILREKTDSLWNCLGCHLAYNLICTIN